MKKLAINYILYIYKNFIYNNKDNDIYKKWATPFMIILEYTYDLYIWILSIIFLPFLLILMINDKKIKSKKFQLMKMFINYTKNNNNNKN
jgi:hypothetical protein